MTHALRRESNRRISGGSCQYRCAGFSLFELAIGITIVGLLAAFLSERMLRYQEYAEKTAMEVTARNFRTGLRLQVADLMMRDRMKEIDRLLQENPMNWLDAPPPNYIGERSNPKQTDTTPGNWYFDPMHRELVYVPFHRRFFKPHFHGSQSVRYRVARLPAALGNEMQHIQGLSFILLTPYEWQIQLD